MVVNEKRGYPERDNLFFILTHWRDSFISAWKWIKG